MKLKLDIELIRKELEKNEYAVGVVPPNVMAGQKVYKNYKLIIVWYCSSGRCEWRIYNNKTKKTIFKQDPIQIKNSDIGFEAFRASQSFDYYKINL